jgi:hypothetical protein
METDGHDVFGGPWILPQIQYGPTRYFADLQLKQFRDVENPHNYIDFGSREGQRMCRQAGIVVCPECGMSTIVSTAVDREKLRCVSCLELIVPLFCL